VSDLTQEAILAELAKLSDSKGKAMSFYDGHTIVPNSLLEQVWLEAERKTEKRIIKLLEADICPDATLTCCDGWCGAYKGAIALIKGEQK